MSPDLLECCLVFELKISLTTYVLNVLQMCSLFNKYLLNAYSVQVLYNVIRKKAMKSSLDLSFG